MTDETALNALREAARLSPENLPLRRHLAGLLLAAGRFAEAADEHRAALALSPGDVDLTIGLAEAYVGLGEYNRALRTLDPLVDMPDRPIRIDMLMVRAALPVNRPGAVHWYRHAVGRDPSQADPELAARLGLEDAPPAAPVPQAPVPPAPAPAAQPPSLIPAPAAPAPASPSTNPLPPLIPASPPPPYTPPQPAYGAPYGSAEAEPTAEVERSRVDFSDVAGMEEVKESLRMKLLLPVMQPELFAAYGKRAGGGVLLYGPPGAGKTHLARAAAGELGAAFIDVGLADILDMWTGSSERNLRATFEMARRNRPCVLFFDEVDALAARRSDMRQAHSRQIVNQFLAELDGVDEHANEGVLVLAATNAPWYIDVAFRRPGRFDQMVFVPPPDVAARAATLSLMCRDKPLEKIDFDRVAKATEGFVGADLKGLVDRAVEAKLQESIRAGRPVPLSTPDLMAAARTMRPTAVREWLGTARNYVLHANESGVWDDLLPWLRGLR
ncbi:AAA family ATPase [Streptosporangium sp. NPDC048047]|uniref:AAA family ATPase n=1 Tax=Streptosporangium sp. NPDC048047 TaxID=3155748 RepID=UPI00344383C6